MADRSPRTKGRFVRPTKNTKMIILVCAKLKEIYAQGRTFNWIKPDRCPRCVNWGDSIPITVSSSQKIVDKKIYRLSPEYYTFDDAHCYLSGEGGRL
jgi:hypothetical protein